jgi:hypothetical protein
MSLNIPLLLRQSNKLKTDNNYLFTSTFYFKIFYYLSGTNKKLSSDWLIINVLNTNWNMKKRMLNISIPIRKIIRKCHIFLTFSFFFSISLIILFDMIQENFHSRLASWHTFESVCATTDHHCVTHAHAYWSLKQERCQWQSRKDVCLAENVWTHRHILMFVCILAEEESVVIVFAWLILALEMIAIVKTPNTIKRKWATNRKKEHNNRSVYYVKKNVFCSFIINIKICKFVK